MPSLKIVEVSRVVVPATKLAPPSGKPLLRLSALDVPWIINPLIQRVLLFDDADGQLPPFACLVASLRTSLAATLARFLPLAGRIVFLPSTGDVAIDCSGSDDGVAGGVRFFVTEMDDVHAVKLAGDLRHDVDTFQRLVPELDVPALPAEVLIVQVTRLNGGVAVGVSCHHAVVDGRSVWMFLEAWAAECRGDAAAAAPTFDRASVAFHGGEELARSTLRKYAPDLPQVARKPVSLNHPRRTFTLGKKHMARLKERISDSIRSSSSADQVRPFSSFVAVAALAWVSFVQAKHPAAISTEDDVYLFFFIDCRGRRGIVPQVSENYFGTCITGCLAKATAGDLLAADGLVVAAGAVQKEVRRATEDPLALRDWVTRLAVSSLPLDRLVNMSGSTRFQAYEKTDFGWGMPSRTEVVTMNNGGQVVLLAAKGGGVQASVCMHLDHMDAFHSHFMNCLN